MRRFIKIVLIITVLSPFIGVIITSCAEESDCSLTSRASVVGNFYTLDNANNAKATPMTFLTITALGTDSVILNQQENVSYIFLPLQYTVDTTALVLHFRGLNETIIEDTIVFKHTNTPYFVSMDCGYEMRQVVTSVYHTSHVLDSVFLKNKNANKDGKENLQLFYTASE